MEVSKKEVVQHAEWFIVLTALIGGFFMLSNQIEHQSQRIDNQSTRTDRLYEMFIEIVKEKR
jgi:hypothetical protein